MLIIDPLKLHILSLIKNGKVNYVNEAIIHCGEQTDLINLIDQIKLLPTTPDNYVYIDFTPYQRGSKNFYKSFYEQLTNIDRKFILLINETIRNDFFDWPELTKYFTFIIFENGKASRFIGDEDEINIQKALIDKLKQMETGETDLSILRRKQFSNRIFKNILDLPGIIDKPGSTDSEESMEPIPPKYFRRMLNGMLVSCYIRLKLLGQFPKELFDLIYEVFLYLSNYFIPDKEKFYDLIAVSSNTTLYIMGILENLLYKPIIILDKLGPIPTFISINTKLHNVLIGKKAIYIEEVSATGSEIDRSMLLLHNLGLDIRKVIALYDLNAGNAMLPDTNQIMSFCKPKKSLNYQYRSSERYDMDEELL